MRRGQRGNRPVAVLVALLVALLALHHPLMGLMPMEVAHASAASHHTGALPMAATGDRTMDALRVAGHVGSACPTCEMSCPLMQGIPPGRVSALPPPLLARGAALSSTGGPSAGPSLYAVRDRAVRATARISPARTRQALLRVFLL